MINISSENNPAWLWTQTQIIIKKNSSLLVHELNYIWFAVELRRLPGASKIPILHPDSRAAHAGASRLNEDLMIPNGLW